MLFFFFFPREVPQIFFLPPTPPLVPEIVPSCPKAMFRFLLLPKPPSFQILLKRTLVPKLRYRIYQQIVHPPLLAPTQVLPPPDFRQFKCKDPMRQSITWPSFSFARPATLNIVFLLHTLQSHALGFSPLCRSQTLDLLGSAPAHLPLKLYLLFPPFFFLFELDRHL